MRTILLAELRGSLRTWLGVSMAFVASSFALLLPGLVGASASAARGESAEVLSFFAGTNMVLVGIVGLTVLGTATNLALGARRGALAVLALNGSTPGQIVRAVMVQLVVVSLLSSVVGSVLAILALRSALTFLILGRRNEAQEDIAVPEPVYSLPAVLVGVAVAVVVAVVGGLHQTRQASQVPPVEEVRQHAGGGETVRMSRLRVIAAVLVVITVVGAYFSVFSIASQESTDTLFNLLQTSLLVLVMLAVLFSLLAPVLIRPLTSAWVRLLPLPAPSWQLARRAARARAQRLLRSVIPVMMTVGLLLGIASIVGCLKGSFEASGIEFHLVAAGWMTMLTLLGLPLLLSLAGGVGSPIMMSKQRDAELALLGVVGATPRQRVLIPLLEAVTIAATVLPTLGAHRMPEPAVIARMVAD